MTPERNPVLYWNQVAREVDRGEPRPGGGITRRARVFAMLHLAMHDAWRACHGGRDAPALALLSPPPDGLSAVAAMGGAAAAVLAGLCPRAAELVAWREVRWNRLLAGTGDAGALAAGRAYGDEIAALMLDPFTPKTGLLDGGWAIEAAARAPPGPQPRYGMAARPFGTAAGTDEAGFDLCDRCLSTIATGRGLGIADSALLFALAHVAMADAAIAAWALSRGYAPAGSLEAGVPTPAAACFRAAASFIDRRFPDDAPLDHYAFDLPDDAGGGRIALTLGRAANDSDGSRVYLGLSNVVVPYRQAG